MEPFRATRLYRRILPAIVGGTDSRIAIEVNADGTIDANGDAVGGTAHACGLAGVGLRLDPATGWFSGPWSPQADGPPDVSAPPMRVLRFKGERAEVFRNGQLGFGDDPIEPRHSDYASCGARAGFGDMVRVPVPEAELDRMIADLERAAG